MAAIAALADSDVIASDKPPATLNGSLTSVIGVSSDPATLLKPVEAPAPPLMMVLSNPGVPSVTDALVEFLAISVAAATRRFPAWLAPLAPKLAPIVAVVATLKLL